LIHRTNVVNQNTINPIKVEYSMLYFSEIISNKVKENEIETVNP